MALRPHTPAPWPLDPLIPRLHPPWPWDANNDVRATRSLFMSKGQHKDHGSGHILFSDCSLLRQHARPTKAHWPLCLQQLFHVPLATPLQFFCLSCPEWATIIVSYSHSFKRGLTPYPCKFCVWPDLYSGQGVWAQGHWPKCRHLGLLLDRYSGLGVVFLGHAVSVAEWPHRDGGVPRHEPV